MPEDRSRPSPESLFAAWLAGREAGEAADFETLCREHADRAAALRELHQHWTRLEPILRERGHAGSLAERLKGQYGSGVDPQVTLSPLLVGIEDAAALLGISPRTVINLCSSGRMPRPVRLDRRRLWRVNELEDWVAAGCPNRERWEADANGEWRAQPGLGGNRPYRQGRGG